MFKALRKWLWNIRLKRAYSRPNLSLDDYMKLMSAAPREMLPKKNVDMIKAKLRIEQSESAKRIRDAAFRELERIERIRSINDGL
jgi:hypothetical protein